MATIRVVVSVDDEHLATIDDVVRRLRERGMTVQHVLDGLGMVTGSIEDVDTLVDVEGVLRVDIEESKGVPPPGEEIQ